MKKIQLAALALVASMSMSAENTTKLRVWIGGEKTEYELSMVDSLTFCTSIEEPITNPEEPLSGVFSVSDNKQIRFSPGNLQYTQSTNTWSFAAKQYEVIGYGNIDGNKLADKIDLFGGSGSMGAAKWGISTSTNNSDYAGDFVDWGQNIEDGLTWRTLSFPEWDYLFDGRNNASNLKGIARINLNGDGTEYMNGLILLPDNWVCPKGIEFKSGFSSEYYANDPFGYYQTFTLSEWQMLEQAGAVLLPESHCRTGLSYNDDDHGGGSNYWSSTTYGPDIFYCVYFGAVIYGVSGGGERFYGRAVRLVKDVK